MYIASLDASKAFDRINHFKLFSILIKKGLPKFFVDILINWYSRLTSKVKWNNCLSSDFKVHSGVRQGGVLSGILFNVYVNDILTNLRKSDLGCHLHNCYAGCLMYADDLILISASIIDLQSMLQICNETAKDLGINFNPTKSVGFQIGPNVILQPNPLVIFNLNLPWVDKVDYLGITLSKAKYFLVDLSKILAKFYSTVY